MNLLLLAIVVWLAGAALALALGRSARAVSVVAPLTVLAGCALAAGAAVPVLVRGAIVHFQCAWPIPFGSFNLGLDPLSAFFVLPVAVVCGLAAVYGGGYLAASARLTATQRGARPAAHGAHKHLGGAWCCYSLLTAAMVVVVTARNGMLFLIAWELMSLVSFFLVMFHAEEEPVRRAGWIYLVASHLGVACLLALFALLGRGETWDFAQLVVRPEWATAAFLLAVAGFGAKAGFVPLHVWLPEAHPAAPSHVSAVMSGVMIKMGLYGLLRTLIILGPGPAWWGWLLVAIGATSGVLGVLFALAQHDLKRLLAYHSVENVGIITLGLGIGVLGVAYEHPAMAALGFAGGLWHILNHALFKSLLFLGAGAVAQATGTRDIEHLGGLLKRMPAVGAAFLIGAAAISGLPPLNGFASELLVYLGGFSGLQGTPLVPAAATAGLVVIGVLALIGGLAAACFAKACGVVFLGEPRSAAAATDSSPHTPCAGPAHGVCRLRFLGTLFSATRPMIWAPGWALSGPPLVLAAACVAGGLLGPFVLRLVVPAAEGLLPLGQRAAAAAGWALAGTALGGVSLGALVLGATVAVLAWLRSRLLAGREVTQAGTWDCGYAAPSPRMQYTASSFAQPLVWLFRLFLRTKSHLEAPAGFFPRQAAFHSETPDPFLSHWLTPVFCTVRWVALRLHGLQQGRIQLYVLYIAVALLVLLVWKLR